MVHVSNPDWNKVEFSSLFESAACPNTTELAQTLKLPAVDTLLVNIRKSNKIKRIGLNPYI